MRDLTCIVLARRDSQRVKDKMLRPFAGSCLLEICLRKLLTVPSLHGRVWLSAREPEIIEIGKRVGVEIWERGPRSLMEPSDCQTVHDYVVGWNDDQLLGWQQFHEPLVSEWFMHVHATNPLLRPETIEAAIQFWRAGGYPSLMAVVLRDTFFYDSHGRMLNPFFGTEVERATLETKLVGPVWEAAHSLYIWHRNQVVQHNRFFPMELHDPFLYPIARSEFCDIDWPDQFERAETLYLAKRPRQ